MPTINGGGFVAVGLDGIRTTSEEGENWSNEETGPDGVSLGHVCFGGGICLVAGKKGPQEKFFVSDNGSSWDSADGERSYGASISGMFSFKNRFFLVGGDGANANDNKPYVTNSEDGLKWGPQKPIGGRYRLRAFATNGELVVGVGDRGRRSHSTDGIEWTDDEGVKAVDTMTTLAYGNGIFVGAGLHGMRMTTENGKSWSAREDGQEGEHIYSMLWTGKQFVGVGEGATYFSSDGRSWDRQPNSDPPTQAAYGNGVFIGTRWKARLLASTDAINWQEIDRASSHLETIAFGQFGS